MQQEWHPAPRWQDWLICDLWRLDHAIALSLGIDPYVLWEGRWVRRPDNLVRLSLLPTEYFNRLSLARSCTCVSLAVHIRRGRTGTASEEHVEPLHFVNWLRLKGLEIPRELQPLISDAGPSARMSSPVAEPARKSTANKAGTRGRKPGSGSIDDTQLLHRMLRLLAKEDARSVYAAAKTVAPTIAGQSRDAIVDRLRKKFKAIFGTSPPAGKAWFDVERELGENWIRNSATI